MSLKQMTDEELRQAKTNAQLAYLLSGAATVTELLEASSALEAERLKRQDNEHAAEVWLMGTKASGGTIKTQAT